MYLSSFYKCHAPNDKTFILPMLYDNSNIVLPISNYSNSILRGTLSTTIIEHQPFRYAFSENIHISDLEALLTKLITDYANFIRNISEESFCFECCLPISHNFIRIFENYMTQNYPSMMEKLSYIHQHNTVEIKLPTLFQTSHHVTLPQKDILTKVETQKNNCFDTLPTTESQVQNKLENSFELHEPT